MLDRTVDRVPQFGQLLGRDGPRQTVLAPEDWSPQVWFETGLPIVAMVPPGYAKLAFDPARFTPASQEERRTALVEAWSGDATALAGVADRFDARRIVIPRDGDHWALTSLDTAALAAADPSSTTGEVVAGNGWDAVALDPGERITLPAGASGSTRLDLRVLRQGYRDQPVRVRVLALPADGTGAGRDVGTIEIAPGIDDWARGSTPITVAAGERLVIEAISPAIVQAAIGWMPVSDPPTGWRVATQTGEAIVLERQP
jgi:hypothetical protein